LTGDLNVAYRAMDVYDGDHNKARQQTPGFAAYERANFGNIVQTDQWVDSWVHLHGDKDNNDNPQHCTFWSRRSNMKSKNKGWRLDYFVITPSLVPHLHAVEIRKAENVSDHVPIVLTLK